MTHKSGRAVLKTNFVLTCLKVVGISLGIFGNIRKSSENRRKSSKVAQTISEIPVMTSQKSHAFDSEKVDRYIIYITVTVR